MERSDHIIGAAAQVKSELQDFQRDLEESSLGALRQEQAELTVEALVIREKAKLVNRQIQRLQKEMEA